jgi:molecular chaperone Hsp33
LEKVERNGLRKYLDISPDERESDGTGLFRSFEPALGKILDDCLGELGEDFRVVRQPQLRCSCGVDRVWRMLAVLPKEDLNYIIEKEEIVEIKCEFCAKKYTVQRDEIIEKLLMS